MVRTASTMLPLGTPAPDFSLPSTDGSTISLADFAGDEILLVIFKCNHCPYVKHIADELKRLTDEYASKGVATVAISSNDVAAYPDDSMEKMVEEKASRGYGFAYLLDEDQSVAKSYRAACTPDFFVFDKERKLIYRGQLDSTRPKQESVANGEDLRRALDAAVAGDPPLETQVPSMGCNIKWIPGNEPDYFGG
ncbi:MAG: thioredoxin family protein [Planctomycetota bacterium]